MALKTPKVSVVIPARNEAPTIREIIQGVKKYAFEVVVIDGNSKDDTANIAKEEGATVYQDEGKGKGLAIRLAIEKVKGDIIVFIDADCSHDTEDVPRLIAPMLSDEKADMVVGSRGKGGSDELQGDVDMCMRHIGGEIINLLIDLRWKVRLTDVQNGLRAIKTSVARSLDLQEKITTIEQEMIMKALKKGYKISEIATHEYARKCGTSVIDLKKVWFRYVYTLFKYLI